MPGRFAAALRKMAGDGKLPGDAGMDSVLSPGVLPDRPPAAFGTGDSAPSADPSAAVAAGRADSVMRAASRDSAVCTLVLDGGATASVSVSVRAGAISCNVAAGGGVSQATRGAITEAVRRCAEAANTGRGKRGSR
jgi:hypothetical protein